MASRQRRCDSSAWIFVFPFSLVNPLQKFTTHTDIVQQTGPETGCAGPGLWIAHPPCGVAPFALARSSGVITKRGVPVSVDQALPLPWYSGRVRSRRCSTCNCRSPCVSQDAQCHTFPQRVIRIRSRQRPIAEPQRSGVRMDRNQPKVTPRHAISTRASQCSVPVCRDVHRQHESRIQEAQAGG